MPALSPLESLLINRCAFPKTVFTPYGPKTVPCGKCLYCRKSHGRTLKSLIHNEMQDAFCVQFFTLTYHEFYVPRISLQISNEADFPYCVPENAEIFRYKPNYVSDPFLASDGQTTIYYPNYNFEFFNLKNKQYKLTSELVQSYNEQSSKDIKNDNICVLYTPDLQNFFKRLRKNLHATNDENIRYYALAEYGGTHFRPHFHVLLFTKHFNAIQIQDAVFKSWHFGRIDYAGEPYNSTSAANYVSQYVTSSCSTPLLLEEISKTRTFHSKYFGLGIIKNNLEFFITHSDYLLNPPTDIYQINFFTSNNSLPLYSEKTSHVPTETYLRKLQKKLIKEYSLTNTSITHTIFRETCNIKINQYLINYIFPRPFGYSRNNDYLNQLILDSYDTFLNGQSNKTYENYINCLYNKYISEKSLIYEYAFGLPSPYLIDTETPDCLKRNCNSDLLEMYQIFLQIQHEFPSLQLFTKYSNLDEAVSIIKEIISFLPSEYELDISQWATELMLTTTIHNRLLTSYYISKHFCKNIKQSLLNTRYFNGKFFNWHLYFSKLHRFETLQKNRQLSNYFSTLEQNTLFPYECFTEDFNNDMKYAKYVIPLQNEYLYSQTKHKELNNKLSPIFFDDSNFI